MNFDLSEEQQVVSDLAAQIIGGHATTARVKAVEAADGFDRELWQALADANLLGLCLPESHGGSGMGVLELTLIAQQQGRHVAPVPFVAVVSTAMCIAEYGDDAMQAAVLPGVAAGSVIVTAALAEAGANAVSRPTTVATPTGDGYRLVGFRPATDAAQHATHVVVPATVDGETALFLVDATADGVSVEPVQSTDRQARAHVTLDTAVPASARFGDAAALAGLHRTWLVGQCGVQLGVAEGSLQLTASHVSQRHQFGRPLSAFQAVGQRAADGYITTEAMRVTALNAAWRMGEGLDARRDVLVAAYWGAEGGQQVTLAAQHLHGGIGADVDYPVHRYFLWAAELANTLGTASSHLAALGGLIQTGVGA